MKQVLLMMPSYYHFDEVIFDSLVKYSGYQVKAIDTSPKLAYRNFNDRVINFFSKVILNKNLKPTMLRKRILSEVTSLQKIDYLIVNRLDLIDDIIFETVINRANHKVLLLWDSLEKVSAPVKRFSAFDKIYSFDADDCEKYGFEKIENFHFWEIQKQIDPTYDAIYLGTQDARIADLNKLIDYLELKDKAVKAFLFNPKGNKSNKLAIEYLKKIIPFKQSILFAQQAKVVIDLAHNNQTGLSFRVFETIALKKKLITTNKHIVQYDFYNANNIFLIEDINQISIPETFWTKPYHELNEDIVLKYGAETWVKKILSYD